MTERKWAVVLAGGALLVTLALAASLFSVMSGSGHHGDLSPGTGSDPPGVAIPIQGGGDLSYIGAPQARYNSSPPTSGPHVPQPLVPGIYGSPIPEQLQVSALKRGHVVIQYAPGTPASEVRVLEGIAREHFRSVLLAPYPELSTGIAATSWGRLYRASTVEVAEVLEFLAAYAE
jgi:hypothetical protein